MKRKKVPDTETTNDADISLSSSEATFAEIIGDLVEQWGFSRHLGRIWSLLYLRGGVFNPMQIQNALSLSAGSVNTSLNELQTWGVIKRVRVAAERSFYYEAESHIWRSVSNVFRIRELRMLQEAEGGLKHLKDAIKSGGGASAAFRTKRIEHVLDAVTTTHLLGTQFVESDPDNIARIAKLINKLRSL